MTTAVAQTTSVSPKVQLTPRQRGCLAQMARRQTNPHRLVRRAKIILAMDAGENNCQITRQMHLNRGTVLYWHKRWRAFAPKLTQAEAEVEAISDKALTALMQEALTDKPRPGAPATFTAEQLVQIVAVACEQPAESGRPISHWTPREVTDEVIKRGIVAAISPRSVGRFLKSGRFATS